MASRTPVQTWPPARRETDKHMSLGLMEISGIAFTVGAGFVLAPVEVTWWHVATALALFLQAVPLAITGWKMRRAVQGKRKHGPA